MKAVRYIYGTSSHLRYPFLPVCEFPFGREAYKRLSIGSWTSECAEQGTKKFEIKGCRLMYMYLLHEWQGLILCCGIWGMWDMGCVCVGEHVWGCGERERNYQVGDILISHTNYPSPLPLVGDNPL